MQGKYNPIGMRFSYLENAILGLQRAEMVRNTYICFHIEYSLSELWLWLSRNPSVAVQIYTLTKYKFAGDVS